MQCFKIADEADVIHDDRAAVSVQNLCHSLRSSSGRWVAKVKVSGNYSARACKWVYKENQLLALTALAD